MKMFLDWKTEKLAQLRLLPTISGCISVPARTRQSQHVAVEIVVGCQFPFTFRSTSKFRNFCWHFPQPEITYVQSIQANN
ncbi:unnamed protein product [Onchocerca flexuosa]|uniref:Ovule protein n=1 Tax=Onchocerca flexuosa TaxID=387005 RepID=A0A183HXU6_9BILA|nr:unnamed protein product [Onchocerca flexuosa]